jgi:hypothetical protein
MYVCTKYHRVPQPSITCPWPVTTEAGASRLTGSPEKRDLPNLVKNIACLYVHRKPLLVMTFQTIYEQ